MSVVNYIPCVNCGHKLPDSFSKSCPNCGYSTPFFKKVGIEDKGKGNDKIEIFGVTVYKKSLEKNGYIITIVAILTFYPSFLSILPISNSFLANYLSSWNVFFISILCGIESLIIGTYAVTRIIVIERSKLSD